MMAEEKKLNPKWSEVEGDFDPTTAGWKFNPDICVIDMIEILLVEFDTASPKPGQSKDFIAGICIDPAGFYQLAAELVKAAKFAEAKALVEWHIYRGLPVGLVGEEAIFLAISPSLAPAILHQQMHHNQHVSVPPDEPRVFGELEDIKPGIFGKPDKEDMH